MASDVRATARGILSSLDGGAPAASRDGSTDVRSILSSLYVPPANTPDEEEQPTNKPGLLESAVRGVGQGVTLGFQDEIAGALDAAFTSKSYSQGRDEARAANEAARQAHPIAFGAGEIGGSVALGAVTGGTAAAGRGAIGAAKVAGLEGAIYGAGSSNADLTKGEVSQLAADTVKSAALGAGTGYAFSKAFGKYADDSIERRAKHLTEDIGDGAVPTAKRRLGQATGVNPNSETSLAVSILDGDQQFLKALDKGQKEALDVVKDRLDTLKSHRAPLYNEVDKVTGGISLGTIKNHFDEAIEAATTPGNRTMRSALEEARDDVMNIWGKRLKDLPPEADIADVMVPTIDVRDWVSKLKSEALQSMGSLSESERKVIKERIHATGDQLLKGQLAAAAKAQPLLEPAVKEISELNRHLHVYVSAKEALEKAVERKNWSPQSFVGNLQKAGLPGVAAIAGAGGDLIGGGLAFGATKLAQKAAHKANRAMTQKLARLVTEAKQGNASKAAALEAIKAGVPTGMVMSILGSMRQMPGWASELPSETPED